MIKGFSIYCLLVMVLSITLQRCASDHIISRPTIEKNPDWQMVESCGYEGCTPKVDFLSSNDIRIRIEAFNSGIRPPLFVIKVEFVGIDFFSFKSSQFTFDSSAVTVKLADGKILKPKVFTCSYTIWDLQRMRSKPSLMGQLPIVGDNSCFILFFDYPPPSVDEEFLLNLDGLKRGGQYIEVPAIFFRKGISRY
jgi:hypothetical protein